LPAPSCRVGQSTDDEDEAGNCSQNTLEKCGYIAVQSADWQYKSKLTKYPMAIQVGIQARRPRTRPAMANRRSDVDRRPLKERRLPKGAAPAIGATNGETARSPHRRIPGFESAKIVQIIPKAPKIGSPITA
jgi:hypothetical protein